MKCDNCSKFRLKALDAEIRYVNLYAKFSKLYEALKEIADRPIQPSGAGKVTDDYFEMRTIAEKALEPKCP